jgi:peptidoglycan/LPS O-acetylase OafA/YrhL
MKSESSMVVNIQLLRGLAAILVFLHHALPHYEAMGGQLSWLKLVSQWGFTGVDIFFVISGYVIAHTTMTKKRTLANSIEFLRHRFLRIYLGYWPFLIIYLLLSLRFTSAKIDQFDIVGSVFLTSHDMFQLVLPVAWSLSFELYFYCFFLLTFLLPAAMVGPLIGAIFGMLVLKCWLAPGFAGAAGYFFLSPFLLEFFAGSLVWFALRDIRSSWLIVPALVAAVFFYRQGMHLNARDGMVRSCTFGVAAVCIFIAAVLSERSQWFKAGRVFVWLGDASYTIYLGHLAFLMLFYVSGARDFLAAQSQSAGEFGFMLFLVVTLASSVGIYRWMEKPLYRFACSVRMAKTEVGWRMRVVQ